MSITQELYIHNTLTRKRERFEALHSPNVGLYVCGPTVYGDAHLGHARPAICFDVLYRYLKHIGYKVRYVRNITDVGHLEHDADEGEDKIAKKARLEQLEPMEVAHFYTLRYRENMRALNILPPSIEPLASGHIIEQIAIIEKILQAGYAYESDGSIYFDLHKYAKEVGYGELSGRNIEELEANTRDLAGQSGKRNPLDFALWKKAEPSHIMRWPSPWGDGFPGWHLECTAMSTKYLGQEFDIHGGGMDLVFPHHECEIAQSKAALGKPSVRYWMHNNMITINGQKMGKSLGNFITLDQVFSGEHKLLASAYSPMVVRFFILQAQYRSTLDFSNDALQAAEKGYKRLMEAVRILNKITPTDGASDDIGNLSENCYAAMNEDLNTPQVIAKLFDSLHIIHNLNEGKAKIGKDGLDKLKFIYNTFLFDILGLQDETVAAPAQTQLIDGLINYILSLRQEAKARKDFQTSDSIRDILSNLGVQLKDRKDGTDWTLN